MKRFLLPFIMLALFIPFFVNAETCNSTIIKLESIELSTTSGNVEEVTKASISGKKINLDLKLYDPGDSAEYNIKVKNTSNEDFYFDEESLILNTDYLEYKFIYDENSNIIEAGKEKNIKLRVEYKNKVPIEVLDNDVFNDTNTMKVYLSNKSNTIENPKTGVQSYVIILIFLILVSGTLYVILTNKNCSKYMIFLIGITIIIPMSVYALCKDNIEVEAKIQIDRKEAYFLTGPEVNIKMKQLAGDDTSTTANGYSFQDQNIMSIKHSELEPIDSNKEEKNVVSNADSPYPIYMWFDNGTINYWSEDKTPNLNEDSSHMFRSMFNLSDISGLKNIDTSRAITFYAMFADALSITNLNALSNWKISNVEDLTGTFTINSSTYNAGKRSSLTDISALLNWDTSSVTNMYITFQNTTSLASLHGLENWDVSNVVDMHLTFATGKFGGSNLTDISALLNWDTSSVTTMQGMFQMASSLTNLHGLENWDTHNVESFKGFCINCSNLTDASALYNWNTSSATNMIWMFDSDISLKEIDISNWNLKSLSSTTNANIFSRCTNLKKIKTPKVYPSDVNVKINLPVTLYDNNNNSYTKLDNTSPTETWLTISS